MNRWTLNSLKHVPMPTTLRVEATTNLEAHMWMTWSYLRPARNRIYRTVRGKMIFCGYKYIWYQPNLTEQIQEGDTLAHIFLHTGLLPGSEIWYYLHSPVPDSEWECQGPLQRVFLLNVGDPGTYLYFATRAKGIYKTTTFSAPEGPDPVWVPDNAGLFWTDITQAVLDPFAPDHFRYLVAGGNLFLHYNPEDLGPAESHFILTHPEAAALTGAADGHICWVTPNANHTYMLHVLWNSCPTLPEYWHLRSLDHGVHWTAHKITTNANTNGAGNIQAGHHKGSSAYPAGDVLYVAITIDLLFEPKIARSIDQGITWTLLDTPDIPRGAFRPKLYIDPADQSHVYLGSHPGGGGLYRSTDHGDSWTELSQIWHMDVNLEWPLSHGVIRTRYSDPNLVRVLTHFDNFRSRDYCASWTRHLTLGLNIREGTFTDDNPKLLYLAKNQPYVGGPDNLKYHSIFISEDEGITLYPKSGAHPDQADGGGDSIPFNCGGAADDGILVVPAT